MSRDADIARRLDAAGAFLRAARRRRSAADLAGLGACMQAVYDGVDAVPADAARRLVDALVALERDLHALAEDLASASPPAGRRHPTAGLGGGGDEW